MFVAPSETELPLSANKANIVNKNHLLFRTEIILLFTRSADEVEQNIVICQWRADQTEGCMRQITDLRDNDKSRYFAITEFHNGFII